VYVALAVLPAEPGSRLVLATAGGSPAWLLGPFAPLGLAAARGPLAGPLFYAGLWIALLAYVAVLASAGRLPRRAAVAAIAALHLVFLLAPPLLSQDVFSYLAYARLGAVHAIDPYAAGPLAIRDDPVFGFAGSKAAASVYGPPFTLATYPLGLVSVPDGFWVLKATAALGSLAGVALVWLAAERRDSDPVPAAVLVGLNPALLVHVVGGAHNDALVMAPLAGSLLALAGGRSGWAAGLGTAGAAVKASVIAAMPFLVAGARRRGRAVLAAAAVALAAAALGVAGFGGHALGWLAALGENQAHASSLSLPSLTAGLLAAGLPGDRVDLLAPVRLAYAAAFVLVFASLLRRAWRGADPIAMAGWATLALLLCSAWLVPWYVAWLLPPAALAGSRRLAAATVALTAWTLAVAIPF